MIEDEAERINEAILKREKALKKGNEAEAESVEKALEKEGFEVIDDEKTTTVRRKKFKGTI